MVRMTANLVDLDEYYLNGKGEMMPYWLLVIKKNRDLYKKSIEEKLLLTEEEAKQDRFLSILDRLGFPMDEVGTHLYKDVIIAAYDELLGYSNEEMEEKSKDLRLELKDMYSNFYHVIARDEYDIGNVTFHNYIAKAVGMRKSNDDTLEDAIFGVDYVEEDHFTQAYRIASYIAKKDKKKINQNEIVK